MTINTTIGSNDNWEFKSSPNFNKIYVDGLTGTDGDILFNGVSLSGDLSNLNTVEWNSTTTIVRNNSATNWDNTGLITETTVSTLTGDLQTQINDNTTLIQTTSGSGGGGGGSDVSGLSANWESTYTTVLANSATNWDNTGLIAETTVNTLTGELQTQITLNQRRYASLSIVGPTDDVAVGDGAMYFHIPINMNTFDLVEVHAQVVTAGTTGTSTFQVYNLTKTQDMLSTVISIDSGETGSDTAATPVVINTAADDVSTNDVIRIDVDSVSTTPPQGLVVTLGFE